MIDYGKRLKAGNYLYILRRTLPPWCWRDCLDELVSCCKEYGIDEVCIKIDTGTFTHAFPEKKYVEDYQKVLLSVRDELQKAGITYSLNPNVLQGHGDRGRMIDRKHPDWSMITAPDGTQSHDCACMQSPGWQESMRFQWGSYAATRPATIWIEDDFRTFNHGMVGNGCFCRDHLLRFNQLYQTHYSALELHNAIVSPGEVRPERRMWLDFQSKCQSEMISFLERIVHSVSPDTVVGIMHSGISCHTNEGRKWQDFAERVTDGRRTPFLIRTPLGNYNENTLPGLYVTSHQARLSRAVLGRDSIDEGEIENFPYSTWTKSNEFTRLQMICAMASGNSALTLNLFDHCGMPMLEENREILQMLKETKPFLRGLKETLFPLNGTREEGKMQGIGLYFHDRAGYVRSLSPGCDARALTSDCMAWTWLSQLGLPVTFEASSVTALSGQDIKAASREEIMRILSGGVICDAVAFHSLEELGYGRYLGGRIRHEYHICKELPTSGEHFYCEEFGGTANHYLAMAPLGQPLLLDIEQDAGTVEISEIVDPDTRRLIGGAYWYVNELGGKVFVCPYDVSQIGGPFLNFGRKIMLEAVIDALFEGKTPMKVSGNRPLLPLLCGYRDYLFAGVMNCSLDPVEPLLLELTVERPVVSVERLSVRGVWEKLDSWSQDAGKVGVSMASLCYSEPLFLKCSYQSPDW